MEVRYFYFIEVSDSESRDTRTGEIERSRTAEAAGADNEDGLVAQTCVVVSLHALSIADTDAG